MLASRRQEVDSLRAELAKVRVGPERLAYLQSRQKVLTEQESALGGLLPALRPSELITEVTKRAPRGVELIEFLLTPSELRVKGRGPDLRSLGHFLNGLRAVAGLSEVTLVSLTSGGTGSLVFEVSASRRGAGP